MNSEYIQEIANGRFSGAVFYLVVSLALFLVLFNLLVWVLQTHNRENKMFFHRIVMLLIATGAFLFFLTEGVKANNLANGLYIDSMRMETAEETGIVQDKFAYAHNLYIVVNGVDYIYKGNKDVEVGKDYKIEFYKKSKLINSIEEKD